MKKYTMHGNNGGVRPIESDTGEWFKVEDVLISNNKHLDFTNELLSEKDDKIKDLGKKLTDVLDICKILRRQAE